MKTVSRVISSVCLLVITALAVAAAKSMPLLFVSWYPDFSRKAMDFLANITGVFPFPVWEILAALLLAAGIVSLIKSLAKLKILRWLSGVLWTASLLLLLFTALWGLNHLLPTKTEDIVDIQITSVPELHDAAAYYGEKASALAAQVQRDDSGLPVMDGYAAEAAENMRRLEPMGFYVPEKLEVKTLWAGQLFSYAGTTGIFVPFTGEACVNPGTYAASLPFVSCHELAHRMGITDEEEADFLAFLATREGSVDAQYSAYYSAFLYCYNALYALSPDAALELFSKQTPQLQKDLQQAGEYYATFEGSVQDAVKKVNDAYLKAFDEEGIQSYDLVSNALVAWYEKNEKNA